MRNPIRTTALLLVTTVIPSGNLQISHSSEEKTMFNDPMVAQVTMLMYLEHTEKSKNRWCGDDALFPAICPVIGRYEENIRKTISATENGTDWMVDMRKQRSQQAAMIVFLEYVRDDVNQGKLNERLGRINPEDMGDLILAIKQIRVWRMGSADDSRG